MYILRLLSRSITQNIAPNITHTDDTMSPVNTRYMAYIHALSYLKRRDVIVRIHLGGWGEAVLFTGGQYAIVLDARSDGRDFAYREMI